MSKMRALVASCCLFIPVALFAQTTSTSPTPQDMPALRAQYSKEIGQPLDGKMRHDPSGLTTAYLDPIFPSSHAANLLTLRNGDLLCFWFSGTWEGQSGVGIVMSRLAAGSSQWTTPQMIDNHPRESYQNPVGFQEPNGTIWLLHTTQPAGKGESQSRVLSLQSTNNGETWTHSSVIFETPGSYVRNPLVTMPDGHWMLPMYFTTAGSGGADTGKDRPVVAISADRGENWKICDLPDSNGEVQPSLVYDPAQGYLALLRSRRADHIYRSTSKDGCHWSAPEATDLPNNNASIQILRLTDGKVVLAFNNTSAELVDGKRRTGARKPLSLAISSDFGKSWHSIRDVETGRPGNTDMRKQPGREEYSYPALALGHDGRIYAAYTFRRETIKVISFSEAWLEGASSSTHP